MPLGWLYRGLGEAALEPAARLDDDVGGLVVGGANTAGAGGFVVGAAGMAEAGGNAGGNSTRAVAGACGLVVSSVRV